MKPPLQTAATQDMRGARVAVLGFGVEGRSATRYFRSLGAKVTVCDSDEAIKVPEGIATQIGAKYLDNLDNFDLVVRSPGVLPGTFTTSTPVTSVMNRFLEYCPAKVIGVTGSKGKGTTATLVYKMLRSAGKKVFLGGNIGLPPLDFIDQVTPDAYVVLEMSNLQLWDIRYSPRIAVLLMITPEHLDWHRGDINEYVATKANITKYQRAEDILVHHGTNPYAAKIAGFSRAKTIPYFTEAETVKTVSSGSEKVCIAGDEIRYGDTFICKTSDVQLLGAHNLENVCAAIGAVWQVAPRPDSLGAAIRKFKGLPHRLEFVASKSGVDYYNDSIGTTPEAAMAAIGSFTRPKVLIMGGSDKGSDFDELAKKINASNVKAVVLLGEMADKIKTALTGANFRGSIVSVTDKTKVMEQATRQAGNLSSSGDVVILAPACASFDLFDNYQDRGDQFRAAVSCLSQQQ